MHIINIIAIISMWETGCKERNSCLFPLPLSEATSELHAIMLFHSANEELLCICCYKTTKHFYIYHVCLWFFCSGTKGHTAVYISLQALTQAALEEREGREERKMAASLWLSSGSRGMVTLLLGKHLGRGALLALPKAVPWKYLHTTQVLQGKCLVYYCKFLWHIYSEVSPIPL